MYELIFDRIFKKDLSKLEEKIRNRILRKVFGLERYPELGKHLVEIDIWSLRVGKYRILCKIDHEHVQVLVLTVRHRKSAYKE
jgi:mRNA-degrading endonuclease RelE of RelBE toxin-antitoxin system